MVMLVKVSGLYETEPVGGPPQDKFLNGAAEIWTGLTPRELLDFLKLTEKKIGRKPSDVKCGPREIDLDILLYGDVVINESDLTIPHQQLHLRRFMVEPLAEIAPDEIHPISKKTVSQILRGLNPRQNSNENNPFN